MAYLKREYTSDEETQTDGSIICRNTMYLENQQWLCNDLEIGSGIGLLNEYIFFIKTNFKTLFSNSKSNKTTQTFVDPILLEGERLARDVILYLQGEDLGLLHQDKLSLCLRNCVMEMLKKHEILFTSFAKRLSNTPETQEKLEEVLDELFLNGVTWNRIIALYGVVGRLALYCRENNMHRLAQNIPCFMSSYMCKITPFIRKNGGWNRFCEEFPLEEDMSGKVWRSLLLTGAGLGLVAALLAIHS